MENNNTHPKKKQRTEITPRSAKLIDLDVLDCPVCYEPLTIPTFQCEGGHLVCSSCIDKVKNKCPGPACKLRIGKNRSFTIEKVLESVFVQCRNANFGCPKSFNYLNQGKLASHEKECIHMKCSCPKFNCNFTGSSTSVSNHITSSHFIDFSTVLFALGNSFDVKMNINDTVLVLLEKRKFRVFVVQCLREDHGVYITIRHLLTSLSNVEKYRYRLSYNVDGDILTYESPEVERYIEATSQRPEASFMFVPTSFLRGDMLVIKFWIGLTSKT